MTSASNSYIYRDKAKEKVKEVMMQEPLVSLTELKIKTGYSKPFLACIYLNVRKSNEWRTWCKEFHENNKDDTGKELFGNVR